MRHIRKIRFCTIVFIALLIESIAFFYAFASLKSNYGKTLFPASSEEAVFSEPLQNLKNYTFSYPLEADATIYGISFLTITWDNPANAGELEIAVWDDHKKIGGGCA